MHQPAGPAPTDTRRTAMSDNHSPLAEAIRQARKRAGLSQAELADRLGLRQSSVSQWERASTKPSTAHLLALAEHLGISIVDQLAGTAHPERGHPTTEPPAPTDQPATDQDPR